MNFTDKCQSDTCYNIKPIKYSTYTDLCCVLYIELIYICVPIRFFSQDSQVDISEICFLQSRVLHAGGKLHMEIPYLFKLACKSSYIIWHWEMFRLNLANIAFSAWVKQKLWLTNTMCIFYIFYVRMVVTRFHWIHWINSPRPLHQAHWTGCVTVKCITRFAVYVTVVVPSIWVTTDPDSIIWIYKWEWEAPCLCAVTK